MVLNLGAIKGETQFQKAIKIASPSFSLITPKIEQHNQPLCIKPGKSTTMAQKKLTSVYRHRFIHKK